jgi:hypothetical protein
MSGQHTPVWHKGELTIARRQWPRPSVVARLHSIEIRLN